VVRASLLKSTVLASLLISASGMASERDQAKRLFSSLTGNTANKAQADYYEAKIKAGQLDEAAREIVESGQGFYNVTLKNFYTPMTNEDHTTFFGLNDMSATMIGATRDEINFFDIFWKDIMYQFDGILITNQSVANGSVPQKFAQYKATNDWLYLDDFDAAVPLYNRTKNNMYEKAEEQNIEYRNAKHLKKTQQVPYTTQDQAAVAGIFSTRAWAQAYYVAGTNRAVMLNVAKNFLCLEMEELRDTTKPDFRVRRDVDRTPGGDSSTFKNYCVGCHAGMDALMGAFAYYDYVDGTMVYASHNTTDENGDLEVVGPVAPKYNQNAGMYPDGKVTTSDSWLNLWTEGQNAYVGWGEATSGNGAKSFGKMLSETKKVRTCLSEKAFEAVCNRKPSSATDKASIVGIAERFDATGNMKEVFINAAIACMGE